MSTGNPPRSRPDWGDDVLQEENATVLPFRDAALRRPIDVVAWMNSHAPAPRAGDAPDNVIPLARSSRARRRFWRGPPEGEAA
jgi:hypothetical protein